jgi:hypothetical protein
MKIFRIIKHLIGFLTKTKFKGICKVSPEFMKLAIFHSDIYNIFSAQFSLEIVAA